jgi:aspartyl-tRNA(Asn)/glutamyl-tRNA(Gln) amidotransferase subunit B
MSELKDIHPKFLSLISAVLLPPKDKQAVIDGTAIIANLMLNEIQPRIDAENTTWNEIDLYHYGFKDLLADCAKAQVAGVLENRHVKKIINDCWTYPYTGFDLIQYCRATKILEEAGGNELLVLVKQAIIDFPKAVEELKQGKEKAIGALVGSVMKKQKANPVEIQNIIKTELGLI